MAKIVHLLRKAFGLQWPCSAWALKQTNLSHAFPLRIASTCSDLHSWGMSGLTASSSVLFILTPGLGWSIIASDNLKLQWAAYNLWRNGRDGYLVVPIDPIHVYFAYGLLCRLRTRTRNTTCAWLCLEIYILSFSCDTKSRRSRQFESDPSSYPVHAVRIFRSIFL